MVPSPDRPGGTRAHCAVGCRRPRKSTTLKGTLSADVDAALEQRPELTVVKLALRLIVSFADACSVVRLANASQKTPT